MEDRYRRMLLQLSGEERLKMGCAMFDMARSLVRASILIKNPHATPADIRRALFLRFYGHEYDPATREKILRALELPEATR